MKLQNLKVHSKNEGKNFIFMHSNCRYVCVYIFYQSKFCVPYLPVPYVELSRFDIIFPFIFYTKSSLLITLKF